MHYLYIRAWGIYMGSANYYIKRSQEEAVLDNAPERAIYKDADGVWQTVDGIQREDVKEHLILLASRR